MTVPAKRQSREGGVCVTRILSAPGLSAVAAQPEAKTGAKQEANSQRREGFMTLDSATSPPVAPPGAGTHFGAQVRRAVDLSRRDHTFGRQRRFTPSDGAVRPPPARGGGAR